MPSSVVWCVRVSVRTRQTPRDQPRHQLPFLPFRSPNIRQNPPLSLSSSSPFDPFHDPSVRTRTRAFNHAKNSSLDFIFDSSLSRAYSRMAVVLFFLSLSGRIIGIEFYGRIFLPPPLDNLSLFVRGQNELRERATTRERRERERESFPRRAINSPPFIKGVCFRIRRS